MKKRRTLRKSPIFYFFASCMEILDVIRTNALTMCVLLAFSVLLSSPERSPFAAVLGLFVIYGWVYFVHRGLHMLPTSILNPHVYFHHQHDKTIDRRVELCIETANDLFMSFSLLLVQNLVGLHLVPTSVVVFYGLLYTSVHIVNYSIFGSETHRNHHRRMLTNYGPDTLDHLFGTSTDGIWEDLSPITMNAVVVAPLVLGLKEVFDWKR